MMQETSHNLLEEIKAHPEEWMFCEECDKTFPRVKYQTKYSIFYHIDCPYCKSEEILSYTEISRN